MTSLPAVAAGSTPPSPTSPPTDPLPKDLAANPVLARWITVHSDGMVDVRVGKVELGQGILTALAQLAADELDVELDRIRMLPANTATGPDEGLTSGSMSIADSGSALRLAAANVRELFRAEARRRNSSLSYAELAEHVNLEVTAEAGCPLKSAEQQRVAGTSAARLDLPDKIAGRAPFIHDLRLPGQLFGRVVRPPSPGARLIAVDTSGLDVHVQVVRDGSFLGVLAADEVDADRGVEALRRGATWEAVDTLPDENDLGRYLRAGPHETIPVVDESPPVQPPVKAEPSARAGVERSLRARYSRPFIAHASIAPSCGVAWWHDDGRLSVWSHSQGIHNLRRAIADEMGQELDSVTVEHAQGAGCYGHNAADDAAFDAVLLAKAVRGRPILVRWSRPDELAWAPFGSAMAADVEATVDDEGRISGWNYDVWSQGHTSRPGYAGVPGLLAATTLARPRIYPAAVDPPAAAGAGCTRNALPIYDLPGRRVTGHRLLHSPIRSSALRALGAYLNVFAIESFMDELALEVSQDPLDFRLAHLSDERGRRVLQSAATAAGWGRPLPDGTGLGLGFARYKGRGAYCAVVAEVEAESAVRVRRLTIAVDVGRVVNPDGVRNQIEGGATQATSWTLKERVRFDRRRVTSDDWESYPILRFSEAPLIAVELVSNAAQPSLGAGEAAQGPTAAAIGNAVANAIGVRVRDLPLTTEAVVAAIDAQ